MQLVFLSLGYHPDVVGGAYRYVTELAERLAARGHTVTVIYPFPGATSLEPELRRRVRLLRYPDATGMFWANWRAENRAAARCWNHWWEGVAGPAVTVFGHAYFAPLLGRLAGPMVYLFSGPWAEEHRLARQAARRTLARRGLDQLIIRMMRHFEGRALRQAQHICVASRYMADQLPRWHGAGLPAQTVLTGGVDLERFAPPTDRGAARQRRGLGPEDRLLLAVRRLDPRMGLAVLVRAFGRVAGEFPRAQLWLAGQGPEAGRLAGLVRELGLTERVRLLGFVPEADLPELLGCADATLMPSLDLEGFGLATVESLACGTPVLGSAAGGTREILGGWQPRLLFPPGDEAGLAAKLRELLGGAEGWPSRAECRRFAAARFAWDDTVTGFESVLRQVAPAQGNA